MQKTGVIVQEISLALLYLLVSIVPSQDFPRGSETLDTSKDTSFTLAT